MRFGRHDAFDRFVFEWPESVDAEVNKSGGELIVTFDRAAEIALLDEREFAYRADSLPQTAFSIRAEDGGRKYRIGIDPDARFRVHRWNDERLIAIDIYPSLPEETDGSSADAARDDDLETPLVGEDPGLPAVDDPSEQSLVESEEAETEADEEPDVDDEDEDYDEDDVYIGERLAAGDVFDLSIDFSLQFGVATAEGDFLSDGEGDDGYVFFTDGDIGINAFTTFFDEVEVGASVVLEADSGVDDTINADSAYIYLENRFGQTQIGRTSGAEDDMALGAATIAAGTGGIDGDTSNLGDTEVETSGDAAKVSYFTPRIGGVQFGVSYTPDTGDQEGDNDVSFDLENHVGVGLNFVQTLGELEFALATVGSFGDSEFSGDDDLSAYSLGGTLELDPIAFGASYGHVEEDDDFDFATLGVSAGFGEAYAGIGYNLVDEKIDGVTHILVLSGDVSILPGVELQGDVSYADSESEEGNVASVLAIELTY